MFRFCLIPVFIVFGVTARADVCENHFMVGVTNFQNFQSEYPVIRDMVFAGRDEVTGGELLARLDARSRSTTACEEWTILTRRMGEALVFLDDALHHFRRAQNLCSGRNAPTARDNVAIIEDARRAYLGPFDFVQSIEGLACRD